mgnify:CR=1 FL=1|jgi:hypothetical protein|tara:strand:+ start:378 stop:641 length:264 start_codon:yes stop_codon:yes gene_type:complete
MSDENETIMSDGQYLEMANQFKELIDEKEYEMKKVKEELENVSKNFISLYGIIRMMDYLISCGEIEAELGVLIEVARSFASSVLDDM